MHGVRSLTDATVPRAFPFLGHILLLGVSGKILTNNIEESLALFVSRYLLREYVFGGGESRIRGRWHPRRIESKASVLEGYLGDRRSSNLPVDGNFQRRKRSQALELSRLPFLLPAIVCRSIVASLSGRA